MDKPSGPAYLRVQTAPGFPDGAVYDITQGATMGRGAQCEIQLEDNFASTAHARLTPQGDAVVLEDLGSTNGTYLNGQAVTGPQPLHDGDRIRIGDSEFSFER
jgi:pSer/pThr/pTyr-binding forkhead associated (FHA) protein